MVKRITLLTVILIIAVSVNGKTRTQLSFTASPSINWMSSNNQFVANSRLVAGYDFGLSADVFFGDNERYSLLSGLQILNSGAKLSVINDNPFTFAGVDLPKSTEITYRLRYVEIPLSIKLKTDQFRRKRYWTQLGLSPMINIGSKGDTNDGKLKKVNINEEINLFNLAMNVGVGFDFDLGGNNAFTCGLLFQNGLIDVTTENALHDKTILNSLKFRIGVVF